MLKISKYFFVSMFMAALVMPLAAHGKGDIEEIQVDNVNSWQEEFDLDIRKPGKYNIMITAKDLGGNVNVEGPYNLYLDPNSDLPVCSITNPYEGMRVVGNLNIVGTCVDDDGVSKVELVLDEGTEYEKTVVAEGTEFWSYYLDTTGLEEGPHTIRVIGYDINDEPRINYYNPKNSKDEKNTTLTWQLDRKQPLTAVLDRSMGMLVSGNVKFKGTVTDGNGIQELRYSTDGGKNFQLVKLSNTKDKSVCEFDITVDTKKFSDGPAVLWFKALDKAGSIGYYSFLYFIDNTKPDVKIVSPAADEVMNGKFSVAGYAKDDIGVKELSWSFGDQSGEFTLIPGNPYWSVDVDTIGIKDKSRKFTIHAVDSVNNVVDVTLNIPLNQEDDKPVVVPLEPAEAEVFGDGKNIIVRGIVTDDDSEVKSISVQIDNNEPVTQVTKGTFYFDLGSSSELSVGKHKVILTATDKNDVVGNPYVINIEAIGDKPKFADPVVAVTNGKEKENVPFVNGYEIHPEAGSEFSVNLTSGVGVKEYSSKLTWGKNGVLELPVVALKNVTSTVVKLPITADLPKGLVKYTITATDVRDRVSEYTHVMYITNTSEVKDNELKIVLSDSTIGDDGSIVNNKEYPATAYVVGGKAKTVELVPETPFATAKLVGNQIKLIPGKHDASIGSSEPVKIRVVTDKDHEVFSREIVFKDDTAVPKIKIDKASDSKTIDGRNGSVTISGNVTCPTGVGKVEYRILSATTEIKAGVIASFKPDVYTADNQPIIQNVKLGEDGAFSFKINSGNLNAGMHVVEIIAESAGGNKSVSAVAISTIPEIVEDEKGKLPVAKAPVIAFVDGNDVYGLAAYQGVLGKNFQIFPRADMAEGANPLVMEITGVDEKPYSGKYTAQKAPSLKANILKVNDQDYLSGMNVVLPYATKEAGVITVKIETGATVNNVTYEISGDEIPGGKATQTGAAKIIKPTAEQPGVWFADISLLDLPSRVTNFTVNIKAGSLETSLKGSITIVRPNDNIDDAEKIYGFAPENLAFRKSDSVYMMEKDSVYYYYANVNSPNAEIVSEKEGLKLRKEGKLFILSADQEGLYNDVSIKVTDKYGDVYESDKLNFYADFTAPELKVLTPELHQWLGNTVTVSGTVVDPNGVKAVEYSLDNGASWHAMTANPTAEGSTVGVTFNELIEIPKNPDGLLRLNVRATDNTDHTSEFMTSCFKDTTPPVVEVVEPLSNDVVNGQNLIVFKVRDNGLLTKAEYVAPASAATEEGQPQKPGERTEIKISPLISTFIGTEKNPIDDAMSFVFTDDAGNSTTIEVWQFIIDSESDIPRCEIHVPEEMQVITRDFTISGVVYDDDGPSTIYYKIDDDEFAKIPEMGTSFAIDVPLSAMTDNEHTVTVYAVDINGVRGYETTRTFRISLEEPKGAVELPVIETSVRELVTISGWASDKNGIALVQVSLDNGNSFNDAVILKPAENAEENTAENTETAEKKIREREEWSYDVDTRAIPGGTQVVFLKVTDNYGITGLYSSLINIDNDAPHLNLELPLDDSTTTGTLFFSGYTYDNVEVTDLYVTIRNLEKTSEAIIKPITINRIIGEVIDIKDLEDGFYNVELTGKDKAGNVTNVSRNIHLEKNRAAATVDVLYPLNGEHKQGVFSIYGQASSEYDIKSLRLIVDDRQVGETELTYSGFYAFDMGPDVLNEGPHTYHIDAVLSNGQVVSSRDQTITYNPVGPWVTIENFTYGDFATNRPFIRGQAGYSISEDELLLSKTKEVTAEFKAAVEAKKVASIEISFDNGKTFIPVSTNEKWMYRIENEDLPEGYHFMLVRATMKNHEVAVTRTIIQIDNTKPSIKLISPTVGGRYNQKLNVSGLSGDDVKLEDVFVTLRKGDKSSYEVPSFIQGLYLDFHFWGSTLFDIGAGLTFFDDVVKVQGQWGQFTQEQRDAVSTILHQDLTNMRYGGDNVIGLKILANIANLPFSFMFGHDWEWLSASASLGAQFTWFNQTNSGRTQALSAILAQLEFPRVELPNMKMFSTFSFYTEGSLWFIPTDVASTVEIQNKVFQIAFGFRTNVF